MDFQKPFDLINHKLPDQELEYFGVDSEVKTQVHRVKFTVAVEGVQQIQDRCTSGCLSGLRWDVFSSRCLSATRPKDWKISALILQVAANY